MAYSQSMTGERVKRRGKRGKGERQAEPISRLPFPVILNCYRAQLGIGNTFIRICVYYLPCTCSRLPLPRPCVLPAAACWCLAKTIPINLAASKKPLEHTHTQSAPRPFGCLCLAALLSLSTRSLHYWLSLSPSLSLLPSLSLSILTVTNILLQHVFCCCCCCQTSSCQSESFLRKFHYIFKFTHTHLLTHARQCMSVHVRVCLQA